MKEEKRQSGPKAERVQLAGDWKSSVEKALKKPRPAEGWPKTEKKKGSK